MALDKATLLETFHRLAHGLRVDACGLGYVLDGRGRLLARARQQPRLRRVEIDTRAVHPLLVGAPTLVSTRDDAQHSLELPIGVGMTRRREGLADPLRCTRLPQRNIREK